MAIKLQEKYGDDLQVLFVEVQGASDDDLARFALEKKWLGGNAMWTTERPFNLGLDGIPQFGLIGPDGEIVLSGYTSAMTSQVHKKVEELVKDLGKPSKDVPRDVAKALVDARKGAYAKALTALDKILADPRAADDHAAAQSARDDLTKRIDAEVKRAAWMLDNGYPVEGAKLVGDLRKAVGDAGHGAEALTELDTRLGSDEMKAELEAGKALAKIEAKLYDGGPDDRAKRSLEKLAESHSGTKVAERAAELARMAG